MNMLKNEENSKYRATIKNTMEFDPEILKRFVNFMNNPDEETAVAQFGKGDKYFGICTLLVTMPGLPMFGHGQIEGFEEKYGMEYRRSYRDETPDGYMVDRHERDIFPLMKRRALFSGSVNFRIYDLYCSDGAVNENVFAYSNRAWISGREEKALIFYNNSYYETSGWIKASDPPIQQEDGVRRDNLSEALAIHGESQYFILLREQKTNLWFIRSSKAICENGFFVGLNGYETQVFIDVYEVEDDAKGRWARLNNDLNGRGVADPNAAIKDIFLGELYYRFTELLKPEIVIDLKDSLSKESFIDSLKEPVLMFIKTASQFINGSAGYDAWTEKDEKGVSCKFTAINEEEIFKEYEAFIFRLKYFFEVLEKTTPAKSQPSLLSQIKDDMEKRQMLYSVVVSFGILSLLRPIIGKEAAGSHAADLAFDHWDLDRKLREIYRSFGASDAEAWRITGIAKASLSRTNNTPKWKENLKLSPADRAALIIEENYQCEDFRRILGINIFNDVVWFNKEGFEDALFYSSVFFMLEGSIQIPADEKIDRIAKIYDVLDKAKEKAEYRFDNLLDILTSTHAKADIKSGVKKATAEKTTPEQKEKTDIKKTELKAKEETVVMKTASKETEPKVKTIAKITEKKPKVKTVAKKAEVKPKPKVAPKNAEVKPKAKTVAKKIEIKPKAKAAAKKIETKPKVKINAKKTTAKKPASKSKSGKKKK
jgi:hypothetical protein